MIAGATALGQAALVLLMPLLTRLYRPEDFGTFAVFQGVMATVLVISSLRYEMAIPVAKTNNDARQLLTVALALNIGAALFALLVVMLSHADVARLLAAPGLEACLWLLPVAIAVGGSYKALNYWAVRKRDYPLIARTRILLALANLCAQISAGVAGLGALGIVIGQIVGYAAGAFLLVQRSATPKIRCGRDAFRRGVVVSSRNSNFPLFDAPAALVNTLGLQLPNLLFTGLFGATSAGLYLLAERVLLMPMTVISEAIGQVLFSTSREAAAEGRLPRSIIRIFGGLLAAIAVPIVVIFMGGEQIFAFAFGEDWRMAGLYASWLSFGIAAQFLYSSISVALIATGGQRLNLLIHATLLAAKLAAAWYGYYADSTLAAVMALSGTNVFGYGLGALAVFVHVHSRVVRSVNSGGIRSGETE